MALRMILLLRFFVALTDPVRVDVRESFAAATGEGIKPYRYRKEIILRQRE